MKTDQWKIKFLTFPICSSSNFLRLKVSWHMSHMYGESFLCTSCICDIRLDLLLKQRPQSVHLCGFSPVWISIWRSTWYFLVKRFSHTEQMKIFWLGDFQPSCTRFVWPINAPRVLKAALQVLHRYWRVCKCIPCKTNFVNYVRNLQCDLRYWEYKRPKMIWQNFFFPYSSWLFHKNLFVTANLMSKHQSKVFQEHCRICKF